MKSGAVASGVVTVLTAVGGVALLVMTLWTVVDVATRYALAKPITGSVDLVESIAGVKLKRNYNLTAPKGVNGRNSDNALIQRVFGWEPSISLRTGMEKTYAWIHDQIRSGSTKQ